MPKVLLKKDADGYWSIQVLGRQARLYTLQRFPSLESSSDDHRFDVSGMDVLELVDPVMQVLPDLFEQQYLNDRPYQYVAGRYLFSAISAFD